MTGALRERLLLADTCIYCGHYVQGAQRAFCSPYCRVKTTYKEQRRLQGLIGRIEGCTVMTAQSEERLELARLRLEDLLIRE